MWPAFLLERKMVEDIRDDEAFDHIDSLTEVKRRKRPTKRAMARWAKARPKAFRFQNVKHRAAPITLASHA